MSKHTDSKRTLKAKQETKRRRALREFARKNRGKY